MAGAKARRVGFAYADCGKRGRRLIGIMLFGVKKICTSFTRITLRAGPEHAGPSKNSVRFTRTGTRA